MGGGCEVGRVGPMKSGGKFVRRDMDGGMIIGVYTP